MHACAAPSPASPERERRPRHEVADIFRAHGEVYRRSRAPGDLERRVMRDIETCRTAVLGGHVDVCSSCDHAEISYNSCRNRHCPKCQSLRQARWVAQRMERVLPTRHFHVVFTVPQELRPLALRNRVRFFDILFEAASRTLLELGRDPDRLGGTLGITAVLHTWTRKLAFHPHLHCIVTGGALSPDGSQWIGAQSRGRYLFPVAVIKRLFRGKILAALTRAREQGQLELDGACADLAAPEAFARLKASLVAKDWVVYCKPPFGGAEHVFKYLGRYTHRVGISNHRLIDVDDRAVTFATKNGGTATLAPSEFIRRFLLHVLPRGFVKIRHFGLLAAGNVRGKLSTARQLLAPVVATPPDLAPPAQERTWRDVFARLTGINLNRCRMCNVGTVVRYPLTVTSSSPRAGPPILDTS